MTWTIRRTKIKKNYKSIFDTTKSTNKTITTTSAVRPTPLSFKEGEIFIFRISDLNDCKR